MSSPETQPPTQHQSRAAILERIRSELVDMQLPVPDELRPETRLADDLELTSLDAVDLVLALEDAFEIELEDDDVASFETLQDVVDAVQRQHATPGAASETPQTASGPS